MAKPSRKTIPAVFWWRFAAKTGSFIFASLAGFWLRDTGGYSLVLIVPSAILYWTALGWSK